METKDSKHNCTHRDGRSGYYRAEPGADCGAVKLSLRLPAQGVTGRAVVKVS